MIMRVENDVDKANRFNNSCLRENDIPGAQALVDM